ncbi:hypothetical protein BsWGS_14616 [Bradybaena similaris]
MAAPYRQLLRLRTKEIIDKVGATYNTTTLNTLSCSKLYTRRFGNNSMLKNKNDSANSKTTQLDQGTDTSDFPEEKSAWTQPIPDYLRGDHLPDPVRNTEREYFEAVLNPDKKAFLDSRFYTRERGISRRVQSWLNWKLNINDVQEIDAIIKRNEFMEHKTDQRYLEAREKALGPELGAAHFIVARGGAIKFVGRNQWYVKDSNGGCLLPKVKVPNLFVEAIDASNMKLTYVAFDNLEKLSHLRFLKFDSCPYFDDWCLSRLHRLSHSLEFLEIHNCPGITDNGLSALYCLPKLKSLRLSHLSNVKHLGLLTLLLEEHFLELVILGVTDEQLQPPSWKHRGERRLVRALLGCADESDDDVDQKVQELNAAAGVDNDDVFRRFARPVE